MPTKTKGVKTMDFTQREKDILKYVVKGYKNAEIAEVLGVSSHTVKAYVTRILKKTGLSSRSALGAYANDSKILCVHKKRILIDLDGVLNNYDGKYKENIIPSVKTGAKKFLNELYKKYELKLFTTRSTYFAQKWLNENNLGKYFAGVTNTKEPCFLIIDDRCIKFEGSYSGTLKNIAEFNVWWKQ